MTEKQFVEEVKKLSNTIEINDIKLSQLTKYFELLIEWNNKINLTAITKKEEVYLKHFYDSLTLIKAVDLNNIDSLCDVGTGAGFPGIVIKIFFPNIHVTLIDSLNKRIKFLDEIIEKLELEDIETVHGRMEDYSKKHLEKFDVVTARAVANTAVLAEISTRSIKLGGKLILMKGDVHEELINSLHHTQKLPLKFAETITFDLPFENSLRSIVIFEKEEKTKEKYPRSIDKIKKELKI